MLTAPRRLLRLCSSTFRMGDSASRLPRKEEALPGRSQRVPVAGRDRPGRLPPRRPPLRISEPRAPRRPPLCPPPPPRMRTRVAAQAGWGAARWAGGGRWRRPSRCVNPDGSVKAVIISPKRSVKDLTQVYLKFLEKVFLSVTALFLPSVFS